LGPVSTKPSTYLSNFIIYIATIGDIVDGTDTTHDFNYFSLVYEWPKDVSSILYPLFDVFFSCIHMLNENQHIHKFKLILMVSNASHLYEWPKGVSSNLGALFDLFSYIHTMLNDSI